MNTKSSANNNTNSGPNDATSNRIAAFAGARLDAELAPFKVADSEPGARLGLLRDLKLMFVALGAGGAVVPLGDNRRTARLLAEYAANLRGQ